MAEIIDIKARTILDSRGNPTLEVDVELDNGVMGRASVPSGASCGKFEALEKRDGDKSRFHGKGVSSCVLDIDQKVYPLLVGQNIYDQRSIDECLIQLDGTKNKEVLGANTILAVSIACLKAAALSKKVPIYEYIGGVFHGKLPRCMMNILNGGQHADNGLDIQEFMIIPISANSLFDAVRMGSEVFHSLKKILSQKGLSTNVGDEGGFAPNIQSTKEALDLILEAIKASGYEPGKNVALALDVAASEIYKDGQYHIEGAKKSAKEMITFYSDLVDQYPLISIEDALDEEDWSGWQKLTEALGDKVQLVADDLFVTNRERLERGISEKSANAILIKPNQIGSVTETFETIALAKKNGFNTVISHRSGETEDTFIAHLAVGSAAGQIKTGSLCRTDRVAKYNELIRIEEGL